MTFNEILTALGLSRRINSTAFLKSTEDNQPAKIGHIKRVAEACKELEENPADSRPYKSYKALLTYSQVEYSTPQELVIGQTYKISAYQIGDDFTNVGALINDVGQTFVATDTTPAVWTTSVITDENASVINATVFENTLGGEVTFTKYGIGEFSIEGPEPYLQDKTFINVTGGNPTTDEYLRVSFDLGTFYLQYFQLDGTYIGSFNNVYVQLEIFD